MACEACNAQFTIFKRKKSCTECRRLYCNQCLIKRKERLVCNRCAIFTKRPLSKVELLKLKPKDLIFYLQSKHISTTGCVEKEELVNLILIHVNNSSSSYSTDGSSNQYFNDEANSNPFDQIKQTCQNLFTSFTDKIASDLNLDKKPSKRRQNENIFSQPRSSGRPSQSSNSFSPTISNSSSSHHVALAGGQSSTAVPRTNSNLSSSTSPQPPPQLNVSSPTSPVFSVNSNSSFETATSSVGRPTSTRQHKSNKIRSPPPPSQLSAAEAAAASTSTSSNQRTEQLPTVHNGNGKLKSKNKLIENIELNGSGCECSDDEVIIKFNRNYENAGIVPTIDVINSDEQEAGPSRNNADGSEATGNVNPINTETNIKESSDSSDASSFEELGAVGGIDASGGCVGAEGATTSSDTENWQFLNKPSKSDLSSPSTTTADMFTNSHNKMSEFSNLTFPSQQPPNELLTHSTINLPNTSDWSRPRRFLRRRSDGVIYSQSTSNQATPLDRDDLRVVPNQDCVLDDGLSRKKSKTSPSSCEKCGKHKGNLKKHVAKFKRQLENTNATEIEIKEKLDAFLLYLENCHRNSTDSESVNNEDLQSPPLLLQQPGQDDLVFMDEHQHINIERFLLNGIALDDDDDDLSFGLGDDEGIHVYGTDDEGYKGTPRQFISLNEFEASDDLDDLSVKQLKEILMLNRVDFKGCCEKNELLDRAKRLWNEYNSSPAIEKLPSDDLCKICMDAPIECVILECGHMATCTSCGKVLSECPICRQYIVRVVRFFRA